VMRCDCQFGRTAKGRASLCKHRRAVLERDYGAVSADRPALRRLDAWLEGHASGVAKLLGIEGNAAALAPEHSVDVAPAQTGIAACIDIETTGIDAKTHEIIEIAVGLFPYHHSSGAILGIQELYSSTAEPAIPIPPAVSRLTSITSGLCTGKVIAWDVVRRMISQADLLIAHNAEFERRFLSRIPGLIDGKPLLCTQTVPAWHARGAKASRRLDLLSAQHQIPHISHRAYGDVIATVLLVSVTSPATGTPYFRQILERVAAKHSVLQLD